MSGDERHLRSLAKRLIALSEFPQRRAVLVQALTKRSPEDACCLSDGIVCRGFVERSRELLAMSQTLMWALITDAWPEPHLSRTREAAAARPDRPIRIFLCDIETTVEDDDTIIPIPNYGREPSPTLGERRSIAGQPLRANLIAAMRDPHPMVIAKILGNPKLTEEDVVFIAAKRPTSSAALLEIAKHPKWRISKRVAIGLIYNPALPPGASLTLMPYLDAPKIERIAAEPSLHPLLKDAARSLLSIRRQSLGACRVNGDSRK